VVYGIHCPGPEYEAVSWHKGSAERVGSIRGMGTLMPMPSLDQTDTYRHIHGKCLLAMVREGMCLLSGIVAWLRR
jgi:hypothetical protein